MHPCMRLFEDSTVSQVKRWRKEAVWVEEGRKIGVKRDTAGVVVECSMEYVFVG